MYFSVFFLDYTEWSKWTYCFKSSGCGIEANQTRVRNCTHDGLAIPDEICLQSNETSMINETKSCYNHFKPCAGRPFYIYCIVIMNPH